MAAFSLPRMAIRIGTAALLLSSFAFAQQYTQINLVSDIAGKATVTDANLVNAWGLTRSSSSPWWIADNGTGLSTLYNAAGAIQGLVVTVPPPKDATGPSAPTGIVFNGSTDFAVATGAPAVFIFVTEDGTVSAWNPTVDLHNAKLVVDNSKKQAVYKGATIAEAFGKHYLYVTNFRSGRVEVYDTNFKRVKLSEERFDDDRIRHGFAPFNVQAIGTNIFVTYAKQDSEKHDDVAGAGLGFVDVFSPSGRLRARLQHGPWLNSPWGVAMAPGEFGEFSHSLLVGNFGSGQIAGYNPVTGKFLGLVKNPDNSVLSIDGLWALSFGNGAAAGPLNTLFFSAGPNGEADGLFGTLTPVSADLTGEDEP
jgi:uncharacterized protein (TIGR03118 family)